jgi:hypothetical protein
MQIVTPSQYTHLSSPLLTHPHKLSQKYIVDRLQMGLFDIKVLAVSISAEFEYYRHAIDYLV